MNGIRYETEAWSNPEQWLSLTESDKSLKVFDKLKYTDQGPEHLLMGLRLTEGVDLNRHAALARKPLSQSKLEDLSRLGLLQVRNGRVSATSGGRLILNRVIAELLED